MSGKRLENKVAIVTGGASGIGQAVALRFAEEGARVLVADINPCDRTLELVAGAGGQASAVQLDTTSEADCAAMVPAALQRFGRLDLGVFAAGIRLDPTPMLELEMASYQRMIDINLTGVMRSARAVARHLVAQRSGAIVNIASTAGLIPIVGSGSYCMAKAGVLMMTKVMALELAKTGVRINAVAPGFTHTPMWDVAPDSEEHRWAMGMTPMGRTGTPREQADACLYLASDEAGYVTGQVLVSAGGQYTG